MSWTSAMNNNTKKVVMGVELSGIIRQVQNISVFQQTPINQKVTVNKQVFTFPNSLKRLNSFENLLRVLQQSKSLSVGFLLKDRGG